MALTIASGPPAGVRSAVSSPTPQGVDRGVYPAPAGIDRRPSPGARPGLSAPVSSGTASGRPPSRSTSHTAPGRAAAPICPAGRLSLGYSGSDRTGSETSPEAAMNLSTALRAILLGAATGMRSMTGLAAIALTTPRGAHPAWVGRLGGRWGCGLTSLAAAGELLTDKSPELSSRLESPLFGHRLTMGAVNAGVLAKREGARLAVPVALAVAGAAGATYLGVRWRTFAQRRGRATAGAVVEDLTAIGLAAAATRRADAKRAGMSPAITPRQSPLRPAGKGKGAWLAGLELGANLLQQATPLKDFDV